MSQKIPSQDSNSDDELIQLSLDAYKRAAEYDDYMFGNIEYLDSWIGISTNKS